MDPNWAYDAIAEFYDIDMGLNADSRDIAFYRAACLSAPRRGASRVLELGCGTGRITLDLCEAGLEVVGIDRSLPMLRILAQKAQDRSFAQPPLLAVTDIARLALQGPFDIILCPFSAFTYLVEDADRAGALQSIRSILAPHGRFLLDIFIPDRAVESRFGEEIFDYRRAVPGSGWLERRKRLMRDTLPGVNRIIRYYKFFDDEGACAREIVTESRQRGYAPYELLYVLQQSGFAVVSATADFAGGPPVAGSRVLCVETRAG
jgi:SAM-dependent methyltransferase